APFVREAGRGARSAGPPKYAAAADCASGARKSPRRRRLQLPSSRIGCSDVPLAAITDRLQLADVGHTFSPSGQPFGLTDVLGHVPSPHVSGPEKGKWVAGARNRLDLRRTRLLWMPGAGARP